MSNDDGKLLVLPVSSRQKGRIYATGMNISGQLGLGDKKIEAVNTPKRVPFDFGGKVIKVACGADFSCALTESGLVYAWGHPDKGCLGNGTSIDFLRPCACACACACACGDACVGDACVGDACVLI